MINLVKVNRKYGEGVDIFDDNKKIGHIAYSIILLKSRRGNPGEITIETVNPGEKDGVVHATFYDDAVLVNGERVKSENTKYNKCLSVGTEE